MKRLKMEEEIPICTTHPDILNRKEVRIRDKCRHFLGKTFEGKLYVYCGRCKRLVLVHNR